MPIFRVEKNNNYTTMSNYHFKEKNMSLKAKGLLSLILSLPDDWDFSLEGLSKLSKDNIDAVRTGIKELEKFGYLYTKRIRDEKGMLRNTEYCVYEKPILENPMLDNPMLEIPIQLNTKVLNTNKLNTNINNNNNSSIYDFIETNFCRTLSPIEYEVIKEWEDNELTRYAIKNAVLNQKYNIKYIDKTLYNFRKQNITSVQQAQQKEIEFQENKQKPIYKKKETFSEKLDRWAREAEERELQELNEKK